LFVLKALHSKYEDPAGFSNAESAGHGEPHLDHSIDGVVLFFQRLQAVSKSAALAVRINGDQIDTPEV